MNGISTEQAKEIASHKLVKEAFLIFGEENINYEDYTDSLINPVLISCDDSAILSHMFIEILEGYYPQNSHEILLDIDYLNAMNIPPVVGSEMTLTVGNSGNTQEERTFVLSGYFSSSADDYAQKSAFTNESNYGFTSMYIMLSNSMNIEGKVKKILEDQKVQAMIEVNFAYSLAGENIFNLKSILLILFVLGVVFFCGFLLIYNIYYISLTRDLRFYGLLKTIGTTTKQLRKIVFYQVNVIYLISMPIGLLLGVVTGWKVLSPIFMSLQQIHLSNDFSLFVIIFTLLFTYLTATTSAILPIRKIARLYCIEALVQGNKVVGKRRKKHSNHGAKPWRMAISNMTRAPKKNLVMMLSIMLSVILFMFIYTIVDAISQTPDLQYADFCIQDQVWINDDINKKYMDYDYRLTDEIIDKIRGLDGVQSVIPIYTTTIIADIDEMSARSVSQSNDDSYISREIHESTRENGEIAVYVYGFTDEAIDYLEDNCLSIQEGKRIPGAFDAEKFKSGEFALVNSFRLWKLKVDDNIAYYMPQEIISLNALKKQYEVLALGKPGRALVRNLVVQQLYPVVSLDIYLPREAFMKEIQDYNIQAINVFVEDGREDVILSNLQSLKSSNAIIYDKRDQLSEFQNRLLAIQIVGYSLTLIVFLIGILNYVNTIVCSVYERRRELALLEIIGMTHKQMKRLLIYESAFCIVISFLLSLLLGIPLAKGFLKTVLETSDSINFTPLLVMAVLIVIVMVQTVTTSYRTMLHLTPIERLRASD